MNKIDEILKYLEEKFPEEEYGPRFLTGSRRYGNPNSGSDYDVVFMIVPEHFVPGGIKKRSDFLEVTKTNKFNLNLTEESSANDSIKITVNTQDVINMIFLKELDYKNWFRTAQILDDSNFLKEAHHLPKEHVHHVHETILSLMKVYSLGEDVPVKKVDSNLFLTPF